MDSKIQLAKCLAGDKLTLQFEEETVCVFLPVRFLLSADISSLFQFDSLVEYRHD